MNRILCITLFSIIAVAYLAVPSQGYVVEPFQEIDEQGWPAEEPSQLDDNLTNDISEDSDEDDSLSPQILAEMDEAASRVRRLYPDASDIEAEEFTREKRSD